MTKKPVQQIIEKLEHIEKQLGRQTWISPLVVAVVVGLMTYYFGIKQTKLQARLQAELVERQTRFQSDLQESLTRRQAELTGYTEAQKAVQQWKAEFYKNGILYLSQIDQAFEAASRFGLGKKNKSLATALESFQRLLETAPPGTRRGTRKKLEEYSRYIAHQWAGYDNGAPDEVKTKAYDESTVKLAKAKAALEKFIRPRAPT